MNIFLLDSIISSTDIFHFLVKKDSLNVYFLLERNQNNLITILYKDLLWGRNFLGGH